MRIIKVTLFYGQKIIKKFTNLGLTFHSWSPLVLNHLFVSLPYYMITQYPS